MLRTAGGGGQCHTRVQGEICGKGRGLEVFVPGSPYTELLGEEAPRLTQRSRRDSDVNARLWSKMERAEREFGRERHTKTVLDKCQTFSNQADLESL